MLIQRMTSLAGLFVFAGLIAYTRGLRLLEYDKPHARLWIIAGTTLGTVLATLAKENGALLPVFGLLILVFWLPPDKRRLLHRAPFDLTLFVLLPSLALLGYLFLWELPKVLQNGYGARLFDPVERLMTQPIILLDYVRNLLLPRPALIAPFTDHYPISRGWLAPPITLFAALLWPALLGIAFAVRRYAPAILFGLTFFLAGHLLESGFINLELYFAHRNYVPSFGLYFAVVFSLITLLAQHRRLVIGGLSLYLVGFGSVLSMATSNWKPTVATAQAWYAARPHSTRAAEFVAIRHLDSENYFAAQMVLDNAAQKWPTRAGLQIQRTFVCSGTSDAFADRVALSAERLGSADYDQTAASMLSKNALKKAGPSCPHWQPTAIASMAEALLDNPLFAARDSDRSRLLAAKGLALALSDDLGQAINLLAESFRTRPNIDVALYAASGMHNSGEDERLAQFLIEVRDAAPRGGRERQIWLDRLDEFTELVDPTAERDKNVRTLN